ncbi:Thioesterase/thiol ester dehydrase-isomerase [Calocera viscosa TUFC12733]|uniref:Thioesterase/thiol ester dehydrase-isomerase n=1 Tax=Calocera viscosa (strain TUFC12733) TaxID=1330018 RepID=A0A167SEZ3_CALVF|nr:Thioesterase/thiol ester dehydrase-isomerase [Calocera viscosa TUFC12733]
MLSRRISPTLRKATRASSYSFRPLSYTASRPIDSDPKLRKLYASFNDASSPYYIAPGEIGPADPGYPPPDSVYPLSDVISESQPHKHKKVNANRDAERDTERVLRHKGDVSAEPPIPSTPSTANETTESMRTSQEARLKARQYAIDELYDSTSFWEQDIAWGHLDSFRHLNNVQYVRFFESGRMLLTQRLGEEVGGAKRAQDMMQGKGVSIILKSIDVRFRRPVTYPDTLLIAHKPHSFHPTQFTLSCLAYSYSQQRPVCTAEAVCVWYDYDIWKKCEPSEALLKQLRLRMKEDE